MPIDLEAPQFFGRIHTAPEQLAMSIQPALLSPVRVDDPRTISDPARKFAVVLGGEFVNYQDHIATNASNASITFNMPPPSNGVFIDRAIKVCVPVRITMTSSALDTKAGQTLLNANRDAPRCYPLSGSLNTALLSINNQSISVEMGNIVHPLSRFNTSAEMMAEDYSITPVYPDQSQSYNSLDGAVKNPLAGAAEAVAGTPDPRGAFTAYKIIANPVAVADGDQLVAIVDLYMSEYIHVSPLSWTKGLSSRGLYGVQTMSLSLNFLGNAQRMWSHMVVTPVPPGPLGDVGSPSIASMTYAVAGSGAGGPDAGSFGALGNVCKVSCVYITPRATQAVGPETALAWSVTDIQPYINAGVASGAFGQVTQQQFNTVTLSQIPERMYLFIRRARSSYQTNTSNASQTDTYLAINNITLSFANRSGLLSSATQVQLYEMAVAAGCNLSWSQWRGLSPPTKGGFGNSGNFGAPTNPLLLISQFGTVGSIVCLRPGIDFGLAELESPGVQGQFSVSFNISATNVSTENFPTEVVLITACEGVLDVAGRGSSNIRRGIVSPTTIIEASQMQNTPMCEVEPVGAGSFASSLREGLHKLKVGLKDEILHKQGISRGLAQIPLPLAQQAAQVAKVLGYGCDQSVMAGVTAGVLAGAKPKAPRKSRAKPKGGMDMTPAEISARIMAI